MTWEILIIIVSLFFWAIIVWLKRHLVYTKLGEGPIGEKITMKRIWFLLWFFSNFIPIVNLTVLLISCVYTYGSIYKDHVWDWNFGNNKFINWLNKEI